MFVVLLSFFKNISGVPSQEEEYDPVVMEGSYLDGGIWVRFCGPPEF